MNYFLRIILATLLFSVPLVAESPQNRDATLADLAETNRAQSALNKRHDQPTAPHQASKQQQDAAVPAISDAELVEQFLQRLHHVNPDLAGQLAHPRNKGAAQKLALTPELAQKLLKGEAVPQIGIPASKNRKRSFLGRVKQTLSNIKEKLTFNPLKMKITSVIGKMVMMVWGKVWEGLAKMVEIIVGKSKFYDTNPDGSVKRNLGPPVKGPAGKVIKTGDPLPRMVEIKRQHPHTGQVITMKQPSSWYMARQSKEQFMAMIQGAAVEKTIRATLKTIDRLIVRRLLSATLQLPEWKLSHAHYMLYMYEKSHPEINILNPDKLAASVLGHVKGKHFDPTVKMPIDIAQFMSISDESTQEAQIKRAIIEDLAKRYEPALHMLTHNGCNDAFIPGNNRADVENTLKEAEPHQAYALTTVKPQDAHMQATLKREGKALGKAVFEDLKFGAMITMPQIMMVPLALQMGKKVVLDAPRYLIQKFAGTKEAAQATQHDAGLNDQLENYKKQAAQLHIILEAIRSYEKPIGHRVIAIRINGKKDDNYNAADFLFITPSMQHQLLGIQESIIEAYGSLIEPELKMAVGGMPYEEYIKRLVLPRFLAKVMPIPDIALKKLMPLNKYNEFFDAQGKLRANKKDDFQKWKEAYVADNQEACEAMIGGAYHTVIAFVDFVTMVKTFNRLPKLAGNYVALFDCIDNLLIQISLIGATQGINGDDLLSRGKDRVLNKVRGIVHAAPLIGRVVGEASKDRGLSIMQERRLAHITQQVPGFSPFKDKEALRLLITGDIDAWLKALEIHVAQLRAKKDLKRAEFFGGSKAEDANIAARADKLKKQATSSLRTALIGISDVVATMHGAYREWGVREILEEIDRTGKGLTEMPADTLIKIAGHAMIPHLVGRGLEYIFGKLFMPLVSRISLLHDPRMRAQLSAMIGGALGQAEQMSGGQSIQGRGIGYRLGRGLTSAVMKQGLMQGGMAYGMSLMGSAKHLADNPMEGIMGGGAPGMMPLGMQGGGAPQPKREHPIVALMRSQGLEGTLAVLRQQGTSKEEIEQMRPQLEALAAQLAQEGGAAAA